MKAFSNLSRTSTKELQPRKKASSNLKKKKISKTSKKKAKPKDPVRRKKK